MLDATYRTTRYALPLFFIVVETNVDYQVVASFVIQDETTSAIMEALSVVQSWNSSRNPHLFMTDNCEEEIQAIEAIFPGDCFVIAYFPFSTHGSICGRFFWSILKCCFEWRSQVIICSFRSWEFTF